MTLRDYLVEALLTVAAVALWLEWTRLGSTRLLDLAERWDGGRA